MTGIQLEPGPVATPFEHRPYTTELALCQRYYSGELMASFSGQTHSNGTVYGTSTVLPVTMRTAPTIAQTISNTSGFNGDNASTPDITESYIRFIKSATGAAPGGRFILKFTADAEL